MIDIRKTILNSGYTNLIEEIESMEFDYDDYNRNNQFSILIEFKATTNTFIYEKFYFKESNDYTELFDNMDKVILKTKIKILTIKDYI